MPRDTTDRLRADIDSGTTNEKQPGSDPAAAPLGTDDEAAGARPSESRMATTRADGSSSAQTNVSRDNDGIGHDLAPGRLKAARQVTQCTGGPDPT